MMKMYNTFEDVLDDNKNAVGGSIRKYVYYDPMTMEYTVKYVTDKKEKVNKQIQYLPDSLFIVE